MLYSLQVQQSKQVSSHCTAQFFAWKQFFNRNETILYLHLNLSIFPVNIGRVELFTCILPVVPDYTNQYYIIDDVTDMMILATRGKHTQYINMFNICAMSFCSIHDGS